MCYSWKGVFDLLSFFFFCFPLLFLEQTYYYSFLCLRFEGLIDGFELPLTRTFNIEYIVNIDPSPVDLPSCVFSSYVQLHSIPGGY